MSPRRSSRARTTQPTPAPPAHTNSSTSTMSLSRAERNTRSNNRLPSPRQGSMQRSESIDDTDSTPRVEPLAPRRSRRGNDNEKEITVQNTQEDEEDGEGVEEEITRCICGHAEYPGPPTEIRDQTNHQDALPEELGNFFIQCDNCHVWQHGGCMGLTDESMTPDEYYCEQCKPEFHKVLRGPNGTKSSRYLPVLEASSSRSSSLSSSGERLAKRDSKSNQSETAMSIKRRATMNSRGAYDEDELLRRAIEESKEILGKRSRDDSEDHTQHPKRQRTSSSSPSSLSKRSRSPSQAAGDREGSRNPTNGTRSSEKARSAIARTNREKELRDQQKSWLQPNGQKQQAKDMLVLREEEAKSPPPTPSLSPSKIASHVTNHQHKGNSADPSPTHKSNINNLRKTGRPPARRGRLGRNQYTRDQPANGELSDTPMRDISTDRNGHHNGSPHGPNGITGESGRSSKAKTHPARTSMNEMKRRVAAILEFVGRMQTERTPQLQASDGSGSASSKGNSTPNGTNGGSVNSSSSVISGTLPTASLVQAVEAGLKEVSESNGEVTVVTEKAFTEMASGEMMETLTRELIGWQSVYGKYNK